MSWYALDLENDNVTPLHSKCVFVQETEKPHFTTKSCTNNTLKYPKNFRNFNSVLKFVNTCTNSNKALKFAITIFLMFLLVFTFLLYSRYFRW
jgi:hypothetical protein